MIIEILGMTAAQGKARELSKTFATFDGLIQVQPGCLSCRFFQTSSAVTGLDGSLDHQRDLFDATF